VSRFVLLGHPLGHSISPAIHRAAYRAFGEQHEYELVDAPDEAAVQRQFDELRARRVAGANVTVPHKRLALALADRLDDSAREVGAANVLSVDQDGCVVASNSDAEGLAQALRVLGARGERASVIGNGGAALAAVVSCRLLGFRDISVTARRWQASEDPASWSQADPFRRLGAHTVPWPGAETQARIDGFAGAELVLQATSSGMKGADDGEALARMIPWSALGSETVAYDLVYNPRETPFVREARRRGLTCEGGLSMLVLQAVRAIEIWLGKTAPYGELLAAAERALGERG